MTPYVHHALLLRHAVGAAFSSMQDDVGTRWQSVPHMEAWLPLELPASIIDCAVVIQDVNKLQAMTLSHRKVIGIMCGCDLDGTWAWVGGGYGGSGSMCCRHAKCNTQVL